jgi:hypothetical protein
VGRDAVGDGNDRGISGAVLEKKPVTLLVEWLDPVRGLGDLESDGLSGTFFERLAFVLMVGYFGATYFNVTHTLRRQGILQSGLTANKLLEALTLVLTCVWRAILRSPYTSQFMRFDRGSGRT